jgi:hypothetical protein
MALKKRISSTFSTQKGKKTMVTSCIALYTHSYNLTKHNYFIGDELI